MSRRPEVDLQSLGPECGPVMLGHAPMLKNLQPELGAQCQPCGLLLPALGRPLQVWIPALGGVWHQVKQVLPSAAPGGPPLSGFSPPRGFQNEG